MHVVPQTMVAHSKMNSPQSRLSRPAQCQQQLDEGLQDAVAVPSTAPLQCIASSVAGAVLRLLPAGTTVHSPSGWHGYNGVRTAQVRSRRISQQEFAQALSQVPCARMQFDVDESGIDVRVPCEDVHHEWISASVADTNRDSYDGKGIGLRRKSAGDQSSRASHCRPVQCRATVRSSRPIQRRNRVESRRFASTSSTAQLELRTELVQLFGLHQSSAEVSDHSIEAVVIHLRLELARAQRRGRRLGTASKARLQSLRAALEVAESMQHKHSAEGNEKTDRAQELAALLENLWL